MLKLVLTDEAYVAMALHILYGKGDGEAARPRPLGSCIAATGNDGMTFVVVATYCDSLASSSAEMPT